MNLDFTYYQKRGLFGRPCNFHSEGPHLVQQLEPDKLREHKYIVKKYVNKAIQKGPTVSLNEANTTQINTADRGMNHEQGGWPKEMNYTDKEAVERYQKKVLREDSYINSLRELSKPIEHAILQNNAINIYETYFADVFEEYSVSETLSQMRNIFRHPNEIPRSVSHLSWCPDGPTHFAASYCNLKFQMMSRLESTEAYIWNSEISSNPEIILDSQIPIVNLEWSPNDKHFIVGGLFNGQIAVYDLRHPSDHVNITPTSVSHREAVHSVLWLNTKTGCDFFSTSADGVVKWWDYRHLKQYTDFMVLDMSKSQNISLSHGASCLEYDPTIPAKYLVGTESGNVICGNRKGNTMAEKLPWIMKTNHGPVRSVDRNAIFGKLFLTVAGFSARLWSEDCRDSAVMWTRSYKIDVTAGEWSKNRYSVFFLTRADGYLDLWDLLQEQREPFVSMRVSDGSLTSLRVEPQGKIVVVGDEHGRCHIVQYAESLSTSHKNDKVVLTAMFEREIHREKILETRTREIAYKLKRIRSEENQKEDIKKEAVAQKEESLKQAEEIYWSEVNNALEIFKQATSKKEKERSVLDAAFEKEEEEQSETNINQLEEESFMGEEFLKLSVSFSLTEPKIFPSSAFGEHKIFTPSASVVEHRIATPTVSIEQKLLPSSASVEQKLSPPHASAEQKSLPPSTSPEQHLE